MLNKKQTDGFAQIIKRGMAHYGAVPSMIGQYQEENPQGIIGYVVWNDDTAEMINDKSQQEFYIDEEGGVNVYKDKLFQPVYFRSKNWTKFCNPVIEEYVDDTKD